MTPFLSIMSSIICTNGINTPCPLHSELTTFQGPSYFPSPRKPPLHNRKYSNQCSAWQRPPISTRQHKVQFGSEHKPVPQPTHNYLQVLVLDEQHTLKAMSARLISSRAAATATTSVTRRPPPIHSVRRFYTPQSGIRSSAGGLLRPDSILQSRGLRWPDQIYRYHNSGALAVRQMSFARSLPKLVLKFAKIPAAFGGAAIAGLAYLQFQVER
jgi:hypothetical protein